MRDLSTLETGIRRTTVLVTLVAALGAAHAGQAQQDTSRARTSPPAPVSPRIGRILGVFDMLSGDPLDGVDVTDLLTDAAYRTSRSGLIGLGGFERQNDSSVVRVRKIGYQDTTFVVTQRPADTIPVQIFLVKASVLSAMITSATETEHFPLALRDFEMRVRDSRAYHSTILTPGELRKADGRRLSDVLFAKGIGGVSAKCRRVNIVLDGVPYVPLNVAQGSAGLPDEDVNAFEAVVYYRQADMPAEFRGTSKGNCGVLLLYSRSR